MRITWDQAMIDFPAGHLVVAVLSGQNLKTNRLALLKRLVTSMSPRGQWAIRSSKDRGEATVEIVFSSEADAQKFGEGVLATRTGQQPRWASQRVFGMDREVTNRIEAILKS